MVSMADVMQLEVEEWALAVLRKHDLKVAGYFAATAAAGLHKGHLIIKKEPKTSYSHHSKK